MLVSCLRCVTLILLSRNQPAGKNGARALAGDVQITVLDTRQAVLACDRPGCAIELAARSMPCRAAPGP